MRGSGEYKCEVMKGVAAGVFWGSKESKVKDAVEVDEFRGAEVLSRTKDYSCGVLGESRGLK